MQHWDHARWTPSTCISYVHTRMRRRLKLQVRHMHAARNVSRGNLDEVAVAAWYPHNDSAVRNTGTAKRRTIMVYNHRPVAIDDAVEPQSCVTSVRIHTFFTIFAERGVAVIAVILTCFGASVREDALLPNKSPVRTLMIFSDIPPSSLA